MLDFARETSAMRYRELHGFTYGDPAHVIRADLGRGVEAFVCGVPPEHRLPLRAYHAGMFFKNARPDRLHRMPDAVRAHGGRLQSVLHVSRRRDGVALRALAAAVPPVARARLASRWTRISSAITTTKPSSPARSGSIASSDFGRRIRKSRSFCSPRNRSCAPNPAYRTPARASAPPVRRLDDLRNAWLAHPAIGTILKPAARPWRCASRRSRPRFDARRTRPTKPRSWRACGATQHCAAGY